MNDWLRMRSGLALTPRPEHPSKLIILFPAPRAPAPLMTKVTVFSIYSFRYFLFISSNQFAQEMKLLEIRNAGSKKVPINLIGRSRTRSGRRFRPKLQPALSPAAQAALLAIQEPLPVEEPVEAPAQALPQSSNIGEQAEDEDSTVGEEVEDEDTEEDSDEAIPANPQPTKRWIFNHATGWFHRQHIHWC